MRFGSAELPSCAPQGPQAQGSYAQGSQAQGSYAQGPQAQGSYAQGPQAHSPARQAAVAAAAARARVPKLRLGSSSGELGAAAEETNPLLLAADKVAAF